MRLMPIGFALTLSLAFPCNAKASIVFDTVSTARQTITSPLFGGSVIITSHGPQHFTIDLATHTANVTSSFPGSDLPDPLNSGGFLSYALYNTATTGTVSQDSSGKFDISLSLLFELRITSGPLTGLTFETLATSIFAASNISTLPVPVGTVFADPGTSDITPIYVKFDPTGTFARGTMMGTSSGRTVTINSIVPEPSSLLLGIVAVGLTAGVAVRRRSHGFRPEHA